MQTKRVFQKLEIPEPFIIHHVEWVPVQPEDSLPQYILLDTDPAFFRWAMDRTFSWKNEWKPGRLLHIHGTSDKILPYNKNMQAIKVKGGEHLMVYSRAKEISRLLLKHLMKK